MNYLKKILNQEQLSRVEAEEFIHAIANNEFNEIELGGILAAIQMRGLSLDEFKGFRNSLAAYATKVNLYTTDAIDVCGTGGDGKDTFNISTTTAFVLSAMGYKVVKHGNYGVSSICGSSNVLEYLGYTFTTDEDELNQQLRERNICFIHAPLFHPVLKSVGNIRKSLGVSTFFNAMGPLLNPAQPDYQLTGTFSLEMAKVYQILLKEKRKEFKVVYALDGYDELTLTADARVLGKNTDEIINANLLGVPPSAADHLKGGSIEQSATILRTILTGKASDELIHVVAANAALGMSCFHPDKNSKQLFKQAVEFIKSGQAIQHHDQLKPELSEIK